MKFVIGSSARKNNTYYAVLNCKHNDGKRYSKWVSTGIAVKKGNKRAAEKKLEEFCATYDEYAEDFLEKSQKYNKTHSLTKSWYNFFGHSLLRLYAHMAVLCRNRGRSSIQRLLQLR